MVRRIILATYERLEVAATRLRYGESVSSNELAGHHLFFVRDVAEWDLPDRPAVRRIRRTHYRRHHGVLSFEGEFNGFLTHRIRLLNINLRCDVAC